MSLIFIPMLAAPSSFRAGVTWSSSDRGNAATLSNGNLTWNGATGGTGSLCRATKSLSAGKAYFEVSMDVIITGGKPTVGLSPASATSYTTTIGANAGTGAGWGWAAGQTSGGSNSLANGSGPLSMGVSCQSGDIAQVAVDLDAGKIWFGKNNVWTLSGNPGTGANPAWTGVSGALFPAIFGAANPTTPAGTARFTLASFTYPPPTGFNSWQGN